MRRLIDRALRIGDVSRRLHERGELGIGHLMCVHPEAFHLRAHDRQFFGIEIVAFVEISGRDPHHAVVRLCAAAKTALAKLRRFGFRLLRRRCQRDKPQCRDHNAPEPHHIVNTQARHGMSYSSKRNEGVYIIMYTIMIDFIW